MILLQSSLLHLWPAARSSGHCSLLNLPTQGPYRIHGPISRPTQAVRVASEAPIGGWVATGAPRASAPLASCPCVVTQRTLKLPLSPPPWRVPPLYVLHIAASTCCCRCSKVVHGTSSDGPILPKLLYPSDPGLTLGHTFFGVFSGVMEGER
jgi:hypothetical protein